MSRRVSLPAADDLFRRTAAHEAERRYDAGEPSDPDVGAGIRAVPDADEVSAASRKPSGRIRHDEKMTVYVTSAELVELEQARLTLRAAHGLAVDRGRVVREALALVLADFEANGDESALVRRLTEE